MLLLLHFWVLLFPVMLLLWLLMTNVDLLYVVQFILLLLSSLLLLMLLMLVLCLAFRFTFGFSSNPYLSKGLLP
jgi:hypothetical protein